MCRESVWLHFTQTVCRCILVDPVKKAIGLSHSGWRGTVGKIGKVTIELMQKTYGSDPEDIIAAIGPSICRDCYEVSGDVIQQFRENFDEAYWPVAVL